MSVWACLNTSEGLLDAECNRNDRCLAVMEYTFRDDFLQMLDMRPSVKSLPTLPMRFKQQVTESHSKGQG